MSGGIFLIQYGGELVKSMSRIARSAAIRAKKIFALRGVRAFHARVVSCRPRQNVKTWHKLERALLLMFRDMYGEVPRCNIQGKKMKPRDEFKIFTPFRLRTIIEDLS